ncbi:protein kinase [Rhodococcus spelaei]|uniref:Serine/threonine-protein kinase PknK n=1 Tax=Rhodococcus spelaei TaxID=2546320 RepID=A0A541BNX4_9NOCA|nr:serine/threonine-protein kinase [Rhodococcus spelaei]TQF74037.1 protein kinase [Rhodococcus spelaei]
MGDVDSFASPRDGAGITAELSAAGFEKPEEVGRGGFGIVYRCLQRALDRTVAVKVLTADLDEDNLERIQREQRAMGRLSGHPHIVDILQSGVTGSGRPYIVMPYHRHNSLDALVRAQGPMDWAEAVAVAVKVAGALETAHRVGTLHRDVKPANILLTGFGEPQLTDFGIARVAGGFETSAGAVTGSPAFTAPEVLLGRPPTAASDVYSLGSTLFCLVTGHAAYERRSGEQVVAQFLRITTQPLPDLRPDGLPADLCTVIEGAMSEDPADRPPSAAALGDALREVQRRHGLRIDEMALPDDVAPEGTDADVTAAFPAPLPSRAATARRSARTPGRGASATTTPPTPETRFRPPTPTRALVERRQLVEAMRIDQRRRLTVVHAPAGFGKSTLAAQWRDALTADGVAVAWLTVDNDDDNAVWFLAHLVEAIRRAAPSLAEQLQLTLEEHADEAERYVLTSLVNEIHDRGERIALVIDDWHRVSGTATIDALDFLLENGCHHLQVLVTSRNVTGLPMSRMRVRDELVEIDSAALRFDVAESQQMLVELGGLRLSDADVAGLNQSTDGWVAALQLAALSLRERDDPAELIDSISGRHHAIAEYLAENVLDTIDSDTLEFMLATSMTARTCGELASALTGSQRGLAMLEEVERRDLFLRRIENDNDWFRYHHLFSQYLRRRLDRDHPERVPELHRTAARWLARHEHLSEAVDHALRAGDPGLAVDLVEAHGSDLVERSRLATLLGLVGKLPPAVAATRPRLQLAVAWSNALLQRVAPAETALDLVDATLEDGGLTAVEIGDLRTEAAVVKGVLAVSAGRLDGVRELTAACRERADTLRPWVMSAAANVASLSALHRYDFAEVRRLQEWAHRYHEQTDNPFSATYGYCFSGIAANEELDVAAAEQDFRTALAHGARLGGGSHITRLTGSLLGNLLYQRGDIAEAERLLDESIELPTGPTGIDFRLTSLGAGPKIRALRDTLTSSARDLWGRVNSPESDSPSAGLADSATPEVVGLAAYTAEIEEIAGIRALIAEDFPGAAEDACVRSRALVARLDGHGRPRALLEAQRLLAASLAAAGHRDEACATLAPVAATCAELGLVRFMLDEGPPIVTAVTALAEDRRSGRWPPERPNVPLGFLEKVLAAAAEPNESG